MKLETQLFQLCQSNNYNCSITYQRINDYSIEIYRGYGNSYNKIFYTDGHIDINVAIKLGLKFFKNNNIDVVKDKFKLIKPFDNNKKGKVFDSFGGLVRGVYCDEINDKINFDNKEYFKLV